MAYAGAEGDCTFDVRQVTFRVPPQMLQTDDIDAFPTLSLFAAITITA